jgi:ferric-dicitrate binding protein FerR (iron transport regulator)
MEEKLPVGERIVDHLLGEEMTETSNKFVSEWQQANPENKNDLHKYQQIWDKTEVAHRHSKFDTAKAWKKVDSSIESHQFRLRRMKNMAYAVSGMAASLLVFLAFTFYTGLFSDAEAKIAMSTTYGSRSEVVLPDGSVVKLNAGSNLEYHFDPVQKIRTVNFSGEAFFDVAKSKQPFVINTPDGLKVKVLGTKFNLSAYPEDHLVQTSLVEGKVKLNAGGAEELVLNPGQIATFDKQTHELDYATGEVSHQLGWTQDKLYMDNMSLQEVCIRLERWYDVDITLSEKSLGDKIHYTGVLKEQTVSDVLNALCRLSSIEYELKGKDIIISGGN